MMMDVKDFEPIAGETHEVYLLRIAKLAPPKRTKWPKGVLSQKGAWYGRESTVSRLERESKWLVRDVKLRD
jgi:hypothetical protein